MGLLFTNDLHDEFGSWAFGYIPYGGADIGEVQAVARAVGDGDDGDYNREWVAAGDRLAAEAADAQARGHRSTARDLYLRASCFYALSYHPLYGEPVDPRLLSAFDKQVEAFDSGLALGDVPVTPSRIPFENTTLPAYLIPAVGRETERRPLVILNNGYDATITDMYFASGAAASRRGYHVLLFDGPGQGEVLYKQGIPLRPDWETVIPAIVDFAIEQPIVDVDRIALSGWSLGGYMAPRGASGEPRIAALVADPGAWSLGDTLRSMAMRFGATPEQVADLGQIDQEFLDGMMQVVESQPKLRWTIVQRGFWMNGVRDLREFFSKTQEFTLEKCASMITCPTLLTMAENDPLGAATPILYDNIASESKTLLRFTAAEGAGDHCEMSNRSLLNQRVLDWLDEVFKQD